MVSPANRSRKQAPARDGTGGRTQDERSAATRESVIAAAFEILHRQGYSGATTYAIAKSAGVSKVPVQNIF
ncbi:MAG: TetR/AcrR family transcriptional regulator [Aquidulcibacter sp.]|nr:TetR/AcrR family transcriptional regulator [Aquidulcibacter sp.]